MDRLVHAIHFAAEKHSNQRRKNALKSPYINHPIKVMYQLTACGISDVPTSDIYSSDSALCPPLILTVQTQRCAQL